jgi:hypothetical protein
MRVLAQRDDDTQHGQPQEQEIGQLVGPEDRAVEHVARDDARKQDRHLGQYQHGTDRFADGADGIIQHARGTPQSGPAGYDGRHVGNFAMQAGHFDAHTSVPTYFSSNAQA